MSFYLWSTKQICIPFSRQFIMKRLNDLGALCEILSLTNFTSIISCKYSFIKLKRNSYCLNKLKILSFVALYFVQF